jgi:hypothetical protein
LLKTQQQSETKEKNMGHKGVSKRKPKKIKPVSNENQVGMASTRKGDSSPVQSLTNKKSTPLISSIATNTPSKIKAKNKKGN